MSGATTTYYSARLLGPDLIVRGQANALSCPIYQSGDKVHATAATVSIYDASNTAQVDGATAPIVANVATYSYTPSATLQLGIGWRIEWAITLSSVVHTFRNDAALVRHLLYPVVTDADLFRRVPALDPTGSAPLTSEADFQDYRDEAWAEIQLRLLNVRNRPNLIMQPTALRQVHRDLSLAFIFDAMATRLNEAYQDQADRFRAHYEAGWSGLSFDFDTDDDGQADSRRSASPTVWLTGRL